jgi:hypothetical protein
LEAHPIFLGNLIAVSTRVIDRFNWYEPVTVALDDVLDALRAILMVYTNSGFYYGGANKGKISASAVGEELFTEADVDNTTMAWILHGVGFLLMVVSILLVLQPLSTAVDIIPFVGDFLQGGLEKCISQRLLCSLLFLYHSL